MNNYTSDKIKSVAIVSHQNAGKTTVAEAILYQAGAIKRFGLVDNGSSQVDYYPLEVEKKITISSKIMPLEWQGNKINVIDTPGYPDFFGEVPAAMSVCEGVIIVIDATAGVQVNTDKVWKYADKYDLPRIIFLNKMDKEHANFKNSIDSIDKLSSKVAVMQIPIGEGENFKGVIDLITNKAYILDKDNLKEGSIPDDYKDAVESAKLELIEKVVETDAELMEKYFAEEPISDDELRDALHKATMNKELIPLLCGSALKLLGTKHLLDKICRYIPAASEFPPVKCIDKKANKEIELKRTSDGKFLGFVFKTTIEDHIGEIVYMKVYSGTAERGMDFYNTTSDTKERVGQLVAFQGKTKVEMNSVVAGDIGALVKLKSTSTCDTVCDIQSQLELPPIDFPIPVYSIAVSPLTKKDQEKLGQGLHSFTLEDPTIKVESVKEFGETVIYGLGEMQIDVVLKKLKAKYNVDVETSKPKIAYRETIKKPTKAEAKYKKQSGGRGQYGHCIIEIAPRDDLEITFENAIFGGAIPSKYIPAVEKGIRDTLEKGIIAGYKAVGINIKLLDGTYHDVDSSDLAFQIAGSFAIKKAFETCAPTLFEPILEVEITVTENYVGDVVGDLNSRRGKILGMDPHTSFTVVKAQVPESEMFKYATDLRAITQGTGDFIQKFSHYDPAPHDTVAELINLHKKQKEEGSN